MNSDERLCLKFQVDAHVSKHLFQECIQRYLAGKTRILATHQLQYIKGVDAIILLEQGKMKYFSHYQDLLEYRPEYGILLAAENEAIDDSSLEKSINIRRQFSSSSNRVSAANMYKIMKKREKKRERSLRKYNFYFFYIIFMLL